MLTVFIARDHALGGVLDEVAQELERRSIVVSRPDRGLRLDEYALRQLLADVHVAVVSSRTHMTASIIEAARSLRGIVYPSIGYDFCDLSAAARAGIVVTNGPTSMNVVSMAEAQVMAILACTYQLASKMGTRPADRRDLERLRERSHTLAGKSVGMLGFGRISRAVVQRLSSWGVGRFLAYTRRPNLSENVCFASLEEVLAQSDVICVNLPRTTETEGLLSSTALGLLQPGASLVVQSRGGIVDELAVAALLESGKLAAAAFDTFGTEPLPPEHPLRRAPRALLTDHNIGHTEEMFRSFAPVAVQAVEDILFGRTPQHVVLGG